MLHRQLEPEEERGSLPGQCCLDVGEERGSLPGQCCLYVGEERGSLPGQCCLDVGLDPGGQSGQVGKDLCKCIESRGISSLLHSCSMKTPRARVWTEICYPKPHVCLIRGCEHKW